MSWTLLLGCLWIVLVSIVALMPFPLHNPYALAMLCLLPLLIVAIAVEHGALWALALFVCAASIYRYPRKYLLRRPGRKVRQER